MSRVCVLLAILISARALADPLRLRLATPAPEGSSYARELHSFSREVESSTNGHVDAKWYMGGIAGDELAQIDRMQRGQLDGAGLAIGCEKLAPSLRAIRVVGLVRSRDEASLVIRHLKPRIDQEMAHAGFVPLGLGTLGDVVAITRTPVRTLADLKKLRMWVWDKDEVQLKLLRAMGFQLVPLPLDAGGPAYDEGRIDGFFVVPSVALAFQWSARARYFLDFSLGEIAACFVMSQRSLDARARRRAARPAARAPGAETLDGGPDHGGPVSRGSARGPRAARREHGARRAAQPGARLARRLSRRAPLARPVAGPR